MISFGKGEHRMNREDFEKQDVFGIGAPNTAFAKYFIGESFLKPLTDLANGEYPVFNVTFEPTGKDTSNEWLEAVDDETYGKLG
jgi:hypothetical protein